MVVTLYEVIATVEDEEVEFLVDPLGRKVELDADEDEDDEDEDDETKTTRTRTKTTRTRTKEMMKISR